MIDGLTEGDQILVPNGNGTYRPYSLLMLFGLNKRLLEEARNQGMAPLHFITQRGPYQDGETPLDMRWDPRTFQIVISEKLLHRTTLWDRRNQLLDLLRPSRSFQGVVYPLVYRKWLPGGKVERGSDLVVANGGTTATSVSGRFLHQGGLEAGARISIEGVDYTISSVPNDFTLILATAYAGSTTANGRWQYTRKRAFRDIFCLLEQGPQFDSGPGPAPFYPQGYREALRFVAHDPFWYGTEQSQTWVIPDEIGDLVFDGAGAFFGLASGNGRWAFVAGAVGETVDVVYWGTRRARPIVYVDGPASDPSMTHLGTGRQIVLDYDVAAGETVIIDTLNLTVSNSAGTNLMPYTSGDLALFGIEPPPVAANRVNQIQIAFSGGLVGVSAARLVWRNMYVGI